MTSDSDSDIEMLGPVSTGAGAARASVPARNSYKANATYQAAPPSSSSSSKFALPPPLAVQPPSQNKTTPNAGNVIEINSDDDDDDAGHAHSARLAPSALKNGLARQVASAPSDVAGKAKSRRKPSGDDSQDEDEELPDIGGGAPFRRTASDTSMLAHRLEKGKGRQTDRLPSPPSSSSSSGRDVNTKKKELFQPEPTTTKARAETSRPRKNSESSDEEEPAKKRRKSAEKEKEPVVTLTKAQQKEQERNAKKAEKGAEKAEKAVSKHQSLYTWTILTSAVCRPSLPKRRSRRMP